MNLQSSNYQQMKSNEVSNNIYRIGKLTMISDSTMFCANFDQMDKHVNKNFKSEMLDKI